MGIVNTTLFKWAMSKQVVNKINVEGIFNNFQSEIILMNSEVSFHGFCSLFTPLINQVFQTQWRRTNGAQGTQLQTAKK